MPSPTTSEALYLSPVIGPQSGEVQHPLNPKFGRTVTKSENPVGNLVNNLFGGIVVAGWLEGGGASWVEGLRFLMFHKLIIGKRCISKTHFSYCTSILDNVLEKKKDHMCCNR